MEIKGDYVKISSKAKIAEDVIIKGGRIIIGDNVELYPGFRATCAKKLEIGANTVIKENFRAFCKELVVGDHNYFQENVWIEGSLNALNTITHIGDFNLICQYVRINCNEMVVIGSDVGIGQNVDIFTHGSFPDVLNGYPWVSAPVKIGNHVWITSKSTILPGVTVGNDSIIGNHSLINKDIPEGSFAAGVPAKIVKEKAYPKKLTENEQKNLIQKILEDYLKFIKHKGYEAEVEYKNNKIFFSAAGSEKEVVFNLKTRKIIGETNEYVEDLRDYLRYRGIKFFTDGPFKSISPADFKRWL